MALRHTTDITRAVMEDHTVRVTYRRGLKEAREQKLQRKNIPDRGKKDRGLKMKACLASSRKRKVIRVAEVELVKGRITGIVRDKVTEKMGVRLYRPM